MYLTLQQIDRRYITGVPLWEIADQMEIDRRVYYPDDDENPSSRTTVIWTALNPKQAYEAYDGDNVANGISYCTHSYDCCGCWTPMDMYISEEENGYTKVVIVESCNV